MAKKQETRSRTLLIVFGVLALVAIVFFAGTDTFQLLSIGTLSLDATSSKGSPNERGVDASTGIFQGEAKLLAKAMKDKAKDKFKEPKAPKIPKCKSPANPKCQVNPIPPPTEPPRPTPPPITCLALECSDIPQTIVVIDTRDGSTRVLETDGGGGVASSTVGQAGGFQTLIRDEVTVHDRFHTPANGQTTTGTLFMEWGHSQPITVTQFLVPNEFFDWFEVELPQRISGDGTLSSFDGISDGEFKYKLTMPDDLIDRTNVIPVRLVIDSQDFVVDGLADIEIERPTEESTTFSFAEFFRSFFAGLRT